MASLLHDDGLSDFSLLSSLTTGQGHRSRSVSPAMTGPVIGNVSVRGRQTVHLGMHSKLSNQCMQSMYAINVCWLEKHFLALSFLYLAKVSVLFYTLAVPYGHI